jgi:hypothetical protein
VLRGSIVAAALCACSLACTVDVADDGGFGSGATAATAPTTADATSSGAESTSGGDATQGDDLSTTGEPSTSTSTSTVGESDVDDDAGASTSDTSDTSDTDPGTPLHPDLETPEDGQPCQTPGSLGECPAVHVCRFHTAEQGLCESCDACGNLNAPCQSGTDCDILFACFAGRCTNICPLGTQYCGPVEACLNVGHPTHGVCDPW